MALLKNIPTAAGVDATYHMINDHRVVKSDGVIELEVRSYLSKEVRDENINGTLATTRITFNRSAWPLSDQDRVYTDLYNALKTIAQFQGSTDI